MPLSCCIQLPLCFWWGPEHVRSGVHGIVEASRHCHGKALHNNPGAMSDPNPHTVPDPDTHRGPISQCSLFPSPGRYPISGAALVPPRCPVPGWGGGTGLACQALPCCPGEPGLVGPCHFLHLVVPLSILKIHSFPAPMVKHCFKCSAKWLSQTDDGALWHVLHIRLVQLGNTIVLNNSARDFRQYLTEKLSHFWLRHCQQEGRGCEQKGALPLHRSTCQAQLTAEALWHSQCSARLPLCHPWPTRRQKIPSGSKPQAGTYLSTKRTAAQMCGVSLCWCTQVAQLLTTPRLWYREFQQLFPQVKSEMEQFICKG